MNKMRCQFMIYFTPDPIIHLSIPPAASDWHKRGLFLNMTSGKNHWQNERKPYEILSLITTLQLLDLRCEWRHILVTKNYNKIYIIKDGFDEVMSMSWLQWRGNLLVLSLQQSAFTSSCTVNFGTEQRYRGETGQVNHEK